MDLPVTSRNEAIITPACNDWINPTSVVTPSRSTDKVSMAESSRRLDWLIQQRRKKDTKLTRGTSICISSSPLCASTSDYCPLLNLPAEIRNRIYELVVPKLNSSVDNPIPIFSEPYALPHVCQTFSREVDLSPIYEDQCYIHTVQFLDFSRLHQWMGFVGSKNINSLWELRIAFAGTLWLEKRTLDDAIFLPLNSLAKKYNIRPGVIRFHPSLGRLHPPGREGCYDIFIEDGWL